MNPTPTVRVVRVRLDGQDDDAGAVAELLARLLPELSEGRCQVGEISRSYPNRRSSGARRYFELYLLNGASPDASDREDRQSSELPPGGASRGIR